MYGYPSGSRFILFSLRKLGYIPVEILGYSTLTREENSKRIYNEIRGSKIKHWIFSGSPHQVSESSLQVPLDILTLPMKFLLICYSMESFLVALGLPLVKRYALKREYFSLDIPDYPQQYYWRNHYFYTPAREMVHPHLQLLAKYGREAMLAKYKNCTLVQFHPEKSRDGRHFIQEWLL
jgi:GMP synthase-like glutamine amidotransferase